MGLLSTKPKPAALTLASYLDHPPLVVARERLAGLERLDADLRDRVAALEASTPGDPTNEQAFLDHATRLSALRLQRQSLAQAIAEAKRELPGIESAARRAYCSQFVAEHRQLLRDMFRAIEVLHATVTAREALVLRVQAGAQGEIAPIPDIGIPPNLRGALEHVVGMWLPTFAVHIQE